MIVRAIVAVVSVTAALAGPPVGSRPDIYSCDQSEHRVEGGYVVNANPWHTNGRLCLNSDGGANFTIAKSEVAPANLKPGGPGLGAFPRIGTLDGGSHGLPLPVRLVGGTTLTWHTTHPAEGAFNTSLDVWFNPDCNPGSPAAIYTDPHTVEIMIWLDHHGLPADSVPAQARWSVHYPDAELGGRRYHVSAQRQSGVHRYVLYYELVEQVDAVDGFEPYPIIEDALARRYRRGGLDEPLLQGSSNLCKVEAGFEITRGGQGLTTKVFSLRVRPGVPPAAVAHGTGGRKRPFLAGLGVGVAGMLLLFGGLEAERARRRRRSA